MKSKFALLYLLGLIMFSSCRKTPCPAYGKVQKNITKTEVKA
ncbi:hypothetical protein MCERE19_00786 [Spirosomataceae bacterium]